MICKMVARCYYNNGKVQLFMDEKVKPMPKPKLWK